MKICGSCNIEKHPNDFFKRSLSKDGLQTICKECKYALKKIYYNNNKEAHVKRTLDWRDKNREKFNEYRRKYKKSKRESDPLFKLRHNLSNRTSAAFRNRSWNKNSKTQEMLGADYETAFNHIESRFKQGMSWDNFGEWQIDHIIPLASAKTEKELIQLCHYTNLQPLWANENIKKGNKIIACKLEL